MTETLEGIITRIDENVQAIVEMINSMVGKNKRRKSNHEMISRRKEVE